MADLKDDLPTAMATAALTGISWYIAIELNVRLALSSRHRGLYFWSVLLCSWGVLLQPVVIILVNFGVWKPSSASATLIYLTWFILVVPQSFVLYSRLHLFMEARRLRGVLLLILFNSIVFSVPTIVLGILSQTSMISSLTGPSRAWDKVQLAVFLAQETLLSILYIWETRKHLKNIAPLQEDADGDRLRVFKHLIYINLLIICLDVSLIGLCYSNLFYVQGHCKPCVYGVKLRMESMNCARPFRFHARTNRTAGGTGPPALTPLQLSPPNLAFPLQIDILQPALPRWTSSLPVSRDSAGSL